MDIILEGVGIFELLPGAAAVGKVKHPVFHDQIIAEAEFTRLAADMYVKPVFLGRESGKVITAHKFPGNQGAAKTKTS